MSDYILTNEHILATVLLKLPVDSLFRFRCVSKSWRDLIDSSYFKEMHRSFIQPLPNPDSKIITKVGSQVYTFDSVVENGRKGYTAIAKRLSSPEMENRFDLAESCNGILLFSNQCTDDLILWNPFTGSTLNCCEQLPSPPYEFTSEFGLGPSLCSAFGYDHLNDDYKLVRWRCYDGNGKGKNLYEVFVYSFTHKSWRTITDAGKLDLNTRFGYLPHHCAFANGTMHWLVENSTRKYEDSMILAFDLGTYEFQKIPCAPIPASAYIEMSLSSLNGCLCLGYMTFTVSTARRSVDIWRSADIWVMKEYGTWTKIACIDSRDNPDVELWCMKAVAYSEKGGKLVMQRADKNLVMYDLKTKSLRDVEVDGEAKRCSVCVCVGGFVSPLHLALIDD